MIKQKKTTRQLDGNCFSSAFSTGLNVDVRVRNRDLLQYDTDSSTMVCNNSANVHICNKRTIFVGEMRSSANQDVATIGGKGHQPSGIGTVRWTWRDDIEKSHEYLIEDALFFPQSPIKESH